MSLQYNLQKKQQGLEIATLQKRLQEVEKLLLQNNNTRIETQVDYDNCYSIITNFVALNNIFFRKQEIIKILDDIIGNNLGSFNNLNDTIKTSIKTNFEKIKTEIPIKIEANKIDPRSLINFRVESEPICFTRDLYNQKAFKTPEIEVAKARPPCFKYCIKIRFIKMLRTIQ